MKKFEDVMAAARDSDAYWQTRVKLHAATQLQDLLAASGLNQEQLALKLDVKPPQVSRILNGMGNPTLDTLVKMARALGCVPMVSFVPLSTVVVAAGKPKSAQNTRRSRSASTLSGRAGRREAVSASACPSP
jgi:predicted XRE-type DNA-binding protein